MTRMRRDLIFLLPLLGCAVVFLWRLSTPGLFDPNEGLYAEVPREMLLRRDWITPRFNFVPYFEKPPLLYWMIASSYLLFGVSEFSARLVTALAALGGIAVTGLIGKELKGKTAGYLSALILGTSFGYFIFSRILLTDLVFSTFLALAFLFFLRGYLHEEGRGRSYLLFFLSMGLATLTKGLIGLVLPLLIVGLFVMATREYALIREIPVVKGGALFLAVVAPWHILVGLKNPDFFWFYFVNEHLLRFLNKRHVTDYAPLPLWLFLLMVLIWFFPWSLFLPSALSSTPVRSAARAANRSERATLFPLAWALGVIAFFSLTPARLEYYSLPAFPALALITGCLWARACEATPSTLARNLSVPLLCLGGLALLLFPAATQFPRLEQVSFYNMLSAFDAYSRDIQHGVLAQAPSYTVPSYRELLPTLVAASLLFLAGTAVTLGAAFRKRLPAAFLSLAVIMLPLFLFIHRGITLFEPHRSAKPLAAIITREWQPGNLLVVDGPYENFASVDFYTGQRSHVLNGTFGDLAFGSRYPEAAPLFVNQDQFLHLWDSSQRVFLLTDSPAHAENILTLRPQSSHPLARAGNKWLLSNKRNPTPVP